MKEVGTSAGLQWPPVDSAQRPKVTDGKADNSQDAPGRGWRGGTLKGQVGEAFYNQN